MEREEKKEIRKGSRLPPASMLRGRPASPDEAELRSSSTPTTTAGAGGGLCAHSPAKGCTDLLGGSRAWKCPLYYHL